MPNKEYRLSKESARRVAEERLHWYAMVLLSQMYFAVGPFWITLAMAWRARGYAPREVWRPFTQVSVVAAVLVATLWLIVGAPRVYDAWFTREPSPDGLYDGAPDGLLRLGVYYISAYIVLCAVLLPHTIGRVKYAWRWKRARTRGASGAPGREPLPKSN